MVKYFLELESLYYEKYFNKLMATLCLVDITLLIASPTIKLSTATSKY